MLSTVKTDCRSTTGNNLRNIMLLVNKTTLNDVRVKTLINRSMPLHHNKWKVDIAKEIIEVKNEKLELQILSYKELDNVLEVIIT